MPAVHATNGDVMAARDAGRPNSPWVFRSVLDKKPRMVTFALNDRLWVAYSVDSCSLYKAWSGSVAFRRRGVQHAARASTHQRRQRLV